MLGLERETGSLEARGPREPEKGRLEACDPRKDGPRENGPGES
jgi:hypothetical protein